MTGLVALWSGAIVDIPAGWKLCDGNNGTPNLKNRFVVGAGDTYAIDDTGGAASHDHDFTADGHRHTGGAGSEFKFNPPAGDTTQTIVPIAGTTDVKLAPPPYYGLAYIMFVGA